MIGNDDDSGLHPLPAREREAYERLAALFAAADASTGSGLRGVDLKAALAALKELDPATQRVIAGTLVESHGNLAAVQTALAQAAGQTQGGMPAGARQGALRAPRSPTVVDARSDGRWLVALLLMIVLAAAAAGLEAVLGQ